MVWGDDSATRNPPEDKSFSVLFFKKEPLPTLKQNQSSGARYGKIRSIPDARKLIRNFTGIRDTGERAGDGAECLYRIAR
jgi:hypothetical protein